MTTTIRRFAVSAFACLFAFNAMAIDNSDKAALITELRQTLETGKRRQVNDSFVYTLGEATTLLSGLAVLSVGGFYVANASVIFAAEKIAAPILKKLYAEYDQDPSKFPETQAMSEKLKERFGTYRSEGVFYQGKAGPEADTRVIQMTNRTLVLEAGGRFKGPLMFAHDWAFQPAYNLAKFLEKPVRTAGAFAQRHPVAVGGVAVLAGAGIINTFVNREVEVVLSQEELNEVAAELDRLEKEGLAQ